MKTHKVSNGEYGIALDGKACACAEGDTYRILGGSVNIMNEGKEKKGGVNQKPSTPPPPPPSGQGGSTNVIRASTRAQYSNLRVIRPDGMMVAGGSTNMIPASQLFVVEPVRAVWRIHLFADCPNCRRTVDLCGVADWWTDGSIEPLEHGTPKADDYEVACPRCGHEFRIKCEW